MEQDSRIFLENLAKELRTQDNTITSYPIYVVQQKKEIWGNYNGGGNGIIYFWIDDPEYWWRTKEEAEKAVLEYNQKLDNFDDYIEKIEYIISWEYLTAHLTKKAAELYIKHNSHNLNELRIYIESQYRCHEFNQLIDIIKQEF
jgi:hypothetical protein